MANQYMTGYNGTVRTLDQLKAWSHWQNLDPEYQRRALAIVDASIVAGKPLGFGEIFRTFLQQESTFLSRHYVVTSGGCCSYNGKRYQLRSGLAHAAPPFKSYHEATTRLKKALAIDFTGNLAFLKANAARYGMMEFSNIGNEPWHGQPLGIPTGRSSYVLAVHDPLKPFVLPGLPVPAPVRISAPMIRMQVGNTTATVQAVKDFQFQCNFWGWRDSMGRTLIVDGDYGQKSAQACISMQRGLGVVRDGVYGNQSRNALQAFLDYMVSL